MNTHDAYAQIEAAQATGRLWGKEEVEAWRNQHDGEPMPEWSLGEWCGELPDDESRDLIEAVIDLEAAKVWDMARARTQMSIVCSLANSKVMFVDQNGYDVWPYASGSNPDADRLLATYGIPLEKER